MSSEDNGSLNFQVDDLVLPFLPLSTVEHWLVAKDPEEVSNSRFHFHANLNKLAASLDKLSFKRNHRLIFFHGC